MWVLHPGQIGIWSVDFSVGRKTREPGKPLAKTSHKLKPHMAQGPELKPGHIGRRRVLHCVIPALLRIEQSINQDTITFTIMRMKEFYTLYLKMFSQKE